MALAKAMSESETDSGTPSLVGAEEVVRIADDHKVSVDDGAPRGNMVPFPRVIPRKGTVAEFGRIDGEAHPRTLPAAANPYSNPRVYNAYHRNMDRSRTFGESREPNSSAPKASGAIDSSSPKTPGV